MRILNRVCSLSEIRLLLESPLGRIRPRKTEDTSRGAAESAHQRRTLTLEPTNHLQTFAMQVFSEHFLRCDLEKYDFQSLTLFSCTCPPRHPAPTPPQDYPAGRGALAGGRP